jgi:hypothetical protein
MIFKYRAYGDISRPVISLILSNGGSYIQHEALVDSGSDRCYFDSQIGEVLGITGESYRVEVGFMPNLGGGIVPYGFVGQKGFFEHFKVLFDQKNNIVELSH